VRPLLTSVAGIGLLVAADLFPGPRSAQAGGTAVAEQSASAGGTAGAGAARSDDPGAAWYNPAALADGAGLRLGAGLTAAMSSLRAEAMDGTWSTDSQGGAAPLPSLHASWSDGRLAAGLSLGVPFGASVTWPEDWPGRHELIASRLVVVRTAPFVAWRHGALRVAGGPHIDAGELRLRRSLDFVDTEGDVELSLRGVGIGLHLAGFARVADGARGRLDLGLVYKSRTRLPLSGEADFTTPDAFSIKASDQRARTALTLPDRLTGGAAWRGGPWTLLLDLELAAWQVHDEVVIEFQREETPDVIQRADWHATVAVRAGAEWRGGPWTARAGLYHDPAPSPADRLSPSSPDSTRLGGSLGLGRALTGALSVDGFWSLLHLMGRESENPDSMPARYGGHAHLVGLGLRYAR
jgi:long-chain fatty acid transport protein